MGASPLMSLGVRALAANYAALQTVGHNIANANVAGYSRQQVELATAQGQFSGAGFFGRGVDVAAVTRTYDQFLTREAGNAKSVAAMDQARATQLKALEPVFTNGENGIGAAVTNFLNAFDDLAARPGDTASRQTVLMRAEQVARRFSDAGSQLESAQRSVTEDLKADVAAINELARSIAAANQKISSMRGLGQQPNDLLDERDRLIGRLAEKVQISTVRADDGAVNVFTRDGQVMVMGVRTETMGVVQDPFDPTRSAVAWLGRGESRVIDSEGLGAGSLAGLLRFQNDDLVRARTLLGQLAVSLTGAVNDQHRLGMNMAGATGLNLFADVGTMLQPNALRASTNAADAGGGVPAQPVVSVVDASALLAAEYELTAVDTGAGTELRIRRLPDGTARPVASGDIVDGLRIDFGNPPPVAGDRFLLQPVSRAALNMAVELRDPRDVAAASPLVASVAPSNTGTAGIASLSAVSASADPALVAEITFGDPNGSGGRDYSWALRDAGGTVVSSGLGSWRAGDTIPAAGDPAINGFALRLTGTPANGDRVTIEGTRYPGLQNGNAQALVALAGQARVGQTIGSGLTFSEAYASALGDIGVRVQGAMSNAGLSKAMSDQAEARRNAGSGVNLDEEAARLIQYQQSYQAAAKVLQIAQQVFDKLLEIAGA